MRLDEALFKIKKTRMNCLRTSDIAAICAIKNDYACHIATRLAESGHLTRLKRDLWCISDMADPMLIPLWITAPFPAYISLQTALFLHGMISQVPVVNYCVSPARTRIFRTPAGIFSVHHIADDFFLGYETDDKTGVRMAVPEKALLDFLYLSPAKSGNFTSLPELEFPRNFNVGKAHRMIRNISSRQRRTMLERCFEKTIQNRVKDSNGF